MADRAPRRQLCRGTPPFGFSVLRPVPGTPRPQPTSIIAALDAKVKRQPGDRVTAWSNSRILHQQFKYCRKGQLTWA